MIGKSILALATIAIAATAFLPAASAGSYGKGYGHGHSDQQCHWEKKTIFIGYNHYGKAIYKWKRVKVCH